ncbi:recombinase family protein [Paenibacillus sp. FJAT-27812]|uniref:recombinase family protein n=1 Tax=Paenibacillus sp. FJAT-27812 TaxID=1684143 RepID=UPI0009ECBC00|nr:recombinase family protein [Paenibacillus sp. FJAT-27812]
MEWRSCSLWLKKNNKDFFVADGYKAAAVIQSFQMAKDGKGPYVISKWLNKESLPTETNLEWTPRRVRYMLSNPTYAAMQRWKDIFYSLNNFESLVSWDDFLYIQSTLFSKEKVWRGKERQLLSAILQCPTCGGKIHSRQTGSKKTRRYVCSNKNSHGNCKSPAIDLPSLNDAVLKKIVDISNGRYSKEQISSKLAVENDESSKILQQLQTEFNNLSSAIQEVFDDFYIHKKLSEHHYSELMKRYEVRQNEIQKKIRKNAPTEN